MKNKLTLILTCGGIYLVVLGAVGVLHWICDIGLVMTVIGIIKSAFDRH